MPPLVLAVPDASAAMRMYLAALARKMRVRSQRVDCAHLFERASCAHSGARVAFLLLRSKLSLFIPLGQFNLILPGVQTINKETDRQTDRLAD